MGSATATDQLPRAAFFEVTAGGGGSVIRLDGALVRHIVWRSGVQPNYAEIVIENRFENYGSVAPGTALKIAIASNGSPSSYAPQSATMFVGRVATRGGEYNPDAEEIVVTAWGPRWDLARDYVLGQEHLTYEARSDARKPDARKRACVTALPCIFNVYGLGNKMGKDYNPLVGADPCFHPDWRLYTPPAPGGIEDTPANVWTAGEMLEYAYRQRLREFRREFRASLTGAAEGNIVGHPLGDTLKAPALGKRYRPGHVNVEGLDIASAFDTIISAMGCRWWVRPKSIGSGPVGELQVCPISRADAEAQAGASGNGNVGRRIKIFLQRVKGGLIAMPGATGGGNAKVTGGFPSRVETDRGIISEDATKVITQVYVAGSPSTIEAEWELVPGWRNFDEIALTTNAIPGVVSHDDRLKVMRTELTAASAIKWLPAADLAVNFYRDLGRRFVLDQTGYDTEASPDGPTFEPDKYDVTTPPGAPTIESPIVPRPRPFNVELLKTALLKSEAEKLPAGRGRRTVQVYVQPPAGLGDAFVAVEEGAWEWDPEIAGIRFVDQVIMRPPFFNPIKPDMGDWLPFARKVKIVAVLESDWAVSGAAGTYGGSGSPNQKRIAVRADHEYDVSREPGAAVADRLREVAARRLSANSGVMGAASFSIPYIWPFYYPLDFIIGIQGRGVGLQGQIVEVRFDGIAQDTHVTLEDTTVAPGTGYFEVF